VCEAAGVGAPALYRQFGDKEGLLSAVVDNAFQHYLASKRDAVPSADPVRDLTAGWDSHVAFALANPTHYRLMHSPAVRTPPPAAAEAFDLLTEVLERCAAAGRLRVSTEVAAQMVMSTNVGLALLLVSQPERYTDAALSARVRDAVFGAILADAIDQPSDDNAGQTGRLAVALAALLRRSPAPELTAGEAALLQEWLTRLSNH
jgi:AcrR family transcriptional regulator